MFRENGAKKKDREAGMSYYKDIWDFFYKFMDTSVKYNSAVHCIESVKA